MPDMSEGICHRAEAIAVELVRHRFLNRRPGSNCLIEDRVDVFHIDHDAHWRSAERRGTFVAHLGILIGEHDRGIANLYLRMADLSIRRGFRHNPSLLDSDYPVVSLICPLMYHMLSNGSFTAPVRPP